MASVHQNSNLPTFWSGYVWIETDLLSYAISRVLSQLNLNFDASPNDLNLNKFDFGQWHPVVYFSRKMIPAKTQYKTHNTKLLTIVETFKTWRHYLEDCKYKVFILTNHNNLQRFIDTKSLSFCQVKWAQELFRYHFQINYRQSKANKAVDTLFCFLQKSLNKEKKL